MANKLNWFEPFNPPPLDKKAWKLSTKQKALPPGAMDKIASEAFVKRKAAQHISKFTATVAVRGGTKGSTEPK